MKKDKFKQKTLVESNIESEEYSIATEENSEIVIPQPVSPYIHTDEAKNSASQSNPSEIKPPKQ